jgi:phosphatidylglycerophosphate synthase
MVIVKATRAELPGAGLEIAGLPVVVRLVKQLARSRIHVRVLSDGGVELPPVGKPGVPNSRALATLPVGTEVVRVADGVTPATALGQMRAEHPEAAVVGGDVFCLSVSDAMRASWRDQTGGVAGAGPGQATCTRISDEATRRDCEDRLFADLLRGDLGFIARHLNKKISFPITRHLLCRLPVTPNQVTIGSALLGLLGCGLVATGSPGSTMLGMAAAQLQSVLDGCDGELARVRFQQTAIGEWLDSLMDDGLNLALVLAITSGLVRNGWGSAALVLGGATAVMLLVYNLVSYRELVRQGAGGELLKIRWKLNRGRDMKAVWATPGAIGPTRRVILTLGRRDTFVFAWMVLAFLHLMPVALLWAFLMAVPCFALAVAQLVLPEAKTEG